MPPAIVQPAASGQQVVPTPVPNGTPAPTSRGARGGAFEAKATQAVPVTASGVVSKPTAPVAAPVDQSVPQYSVSPTGEGTTFTPEASYVQGGKRITTPYSAQATVTTQHGNAPSAQQGGAAQTVERADQIAPEAPEKPLVPEGARVSQEQDNIQLLPEASPADVAKNAYAQNPGLTKEQFNKLNPNSPNGAWEAYVTQQQAAFPSAASIAIAQFSGQPLPESVKESKAYTDSQVLTNDVNAAIANPELAADLGVLPGTEKYSVAMAFDPTFPAKQQEVVRQKAAMTVINGTDGKNTDGKDGVLDTTATMYDGRKIDFSSNKFVEELMKDKKYISDTLAALTKASEDTRNLLAPYQKDFADAHADSLQKKADLDNAPKLAYEELAGTGASQSSVDALAGYRSMKLEIAYQTALIKEGNAQAIYLGQKDLMQQDWDRKLKATDTYEKLANIDSTIFSTVTNNTIQQGQLDVAKANARNAQFHTVGATDTVFDAGTGKMISPTGDVNSATFTLNGQNFSTKEVVGRIVRDQGKQVAAQKSMSKAVASGDPKQVMSQMWAIAKENLASPDQEKLSSSVSVLQSIYQSQLAISEYIKNGGKFGPGTKVQDILGKLNLQDPNYAKMKSAVSYLKAEILAKYGGQRPTGTEAGTLSSGADVTAMPSQEAVFDLLRSAKTNARNEAVQAIGSSGLTQVEIESLLGYQIAQ